MADASEPARLAEFAALREEIAQRSAFQQALMVLNLGVVGSIVGLVVAHRSLESLLLIEAVVSPTFGLLWLDHQRNIRRISGYLNELCAWTPSWEKHIRAAPPARAWAGIYWGAMLLVFVGVSVTALCIALPTAYGNLGLWALWAAGVVLTMLYVVAFWTSVGRFELGRYRDLRERARSAD